MSVTTPTSSRGAGRSLSLDTLFHRTSDKITNALSQQIRPASPWGTKCPKEYYSDCSSGSPFSPGKSRREKATLRAALIARIADNSGNRVKPPRSYGGNSCVSVSVSPSLLQAFYAAELGSFCSFRSSLLCTHGCWPRHGASVASGFSRSPGPSATWHRYSYSRWH